MIRNHRTISKYLLLISVLMLMMLLCACRTRLTNNTEVTSTITDEDGWMMSNYQMRRDQLGMPVAKPPVITGWGSDDSNPDYNDVDYNDWDYDPGTVDDWDEPDDTGADPGSNTDPGSSSTSGNSSSGRESSGSRNSGDNKNEDENDEEEIVVTLDANGGTPATITIRVLVDSTYGLLPDENDAEEDQVKRAGYTLEGWYTEKTGGSLVTPNTPVKNNKDHTLYAHWKETTPPKTEYKVTWKYEEGTLTAEEASKLPSTIKNGENFPNPMPAAHKKNYRFLGWYSGSNPVVAGQPCTADSELEAKFSDQPWDLIYNNAKPAEENYQYYVSDSDDLVRGNPWNEATSPADTVPAFVIIKLTDDTYSAEAAKSAAESKRAENGKYATSKIIVIPKNATDSDSNKLYYQLILHNEMYGGLDGIDSAAADTEASISDYAVDPDKAAPAQ